MILDDLADRYADSVPGCDLVCRYVAGIPMYRIRLVANVVRKQEIPAIPLFVLRLINLGIDKEQELAGALGLEPEFVRAALGYLHLSQFVRLVPAVTPSRFAISELGKQALADTVLDA